MTLRGYKPKTRKAPWTLNQPKPEPVIKRTSRESERMKRERPIYLRDSSAFLRECRRAGMRCPVVNAIPELKNGRKFGHPISDKITETHHVFGRAGALYLWKPGWRGLSKEGHRWVHANKKEAIKRGWLAPPGLWNCPRKVIGMFNLCATSDAIWNRLADLAGL